MDMKSLIDVEAYGQRLCDAAWAAQQNDLDAAELASAIADAHHHFAQVAMSMGYTITPRKPLPSIATTAGDV